MPRLPLPRTDQCQRARPSGLPSRCRRRSPAIERSARKLGPRATTERGEHRRAWVDAPPERAGASDASAVSLVQLTLQPTTREQVEHDCQVEPSLIRRDVRHVAGPDAVGCRRVEFTIQGIGGDGQRMARIRRTVKPPLFARLSSPSPASGAPRASDRFGYLAPAARDGCRTFRGCAAPKLHQRKYSTWG
jgi:hypothetical protein